MHGTFTELMSLVLDGEASAEEESSLRRHLTGCADCAMTWQRWQTVHRGLRAAPMAPPPPGLLGGVLARLDERREQRRQQKLLFSGFVFAWGASMVCLLFAGAVALLWSYNNPAPASALASSGAQALSSLAVVVRALQSAVLALGGSWLPIGIVLLTCLTGAVLLLWLWLVARSSGWRQFGGPVTEPRPAND